MAEQLGVRTDPRRRPGQPAPVGYVDREVPLVAERLDQTVKISCDMTKGGSGGGWLHSYDGNWAYLNGVNSRIDRIVAPRIMLSPYFDDDAWSLYNYTRNN